MTAVMMMTVRLRHTFRHCSNSYTCVLFQPFNTSDVQRPRIPTSCLKARMGKQREYSLKIFLSTFRGAWEGQY